MRVAVIGNGRMGQIVANLAGNDAKMFDPLKDKLDNQELDNYQVIIDFSHPETISKHQAALINTKTPILIATTGHDEEQLEIIQKISKNKAVLHAPNTSYGVNSTYQLIKMATKLFDTYDVEIIEAHHIHKIDSPSGTALYFAKAAKEVRDLEIINGNYTGKKEANQMAIHALRTGGVFGVHTIIFSNNNEQIEITHRALNREIFAQGALNYAKVLISKKAKVYDPINISKEGE